MSNSYNERISHLRNLIASEGLGRAFREAFSAIPAGIGHILDTLLRLDGTILADRENFLSGPFGLLLGLPFAILGTIVGKLVDLTLRTPAYLGYYLLDNFFSLFINKFNEIMRTEYTNISLIFLAYTALTQTPPQEMEGLFGFMFGVVFQTINYAIQRLSATFTAVIQHPIANFCTMIRGFYGASTNASSDDNTQAPPRSRSRFQRPHAEAAPSAFLDEREEFDYFAVLNLKRENYNNASNNDEKKQLVTKAYRTIAKTCHPDKIPKNTPEEEKLALKERFTKLTKAYQILSSPESQPTQSYLEHYDRQHGISRNTSVPNGSNTQKNTPLKSKVQNPGNLGMFGTPQDPDLSQQPSRSSRFTRPGQS